MMSSQARVSLLAVAAMVSVYAIIFPLLTMDTLGRIMARSATLEGGNLLLLLFLEVSRLATSGIGILIALVLIARASGRAEARSLSLFLLFSIISFEKVFGTNGYPGPLQERTAEELLGAGVSPTVLDFLFGGAPWPIWLALAALLRFSVVFPSALQAETLDMSGMTDRRGLLRAKGVAGADIGAFFRAVAKRWLALGGFTTKALTAAALLLIAIHTLTQGPVRTVALSVVAITGVCIAITNVRAAYSAAGAEERVRITWLTEGLVLAVGLFMISAAMLITIPSVVARMGAFVLAMLTPGTIMVCMALSVLDRGKLNAVDAVERTIRASAIALALTVAFGLLYMVFGQLADRLGMSRALAALAAAAVAALCFEFLKQSADRLRLRVLERSV